MRKGLFLLLLVVLAIPTRAQSRSLEVEQWDVVIRDVDATRNTYEVEETLTLNATGTYRRGTRDIDTQEIDSVTLDSLTYNGESLLLDCSYASGAACAEDNRLELNIRYQFPEPLTDDRAIITLTYTVSGGIQVGETEDRILWWVIPSSRGFSVTSGSLQVELPEEVALLQHDDNYDNYASYRNDIETEMDEDITLFTFGDFRRNQSLNYLLVFEHHPDAVRAAWQDRPKYTEPTTTQRSSSYSSNSDEGMPFSEVLLYGTVILIVIGITLYRWANGYPIFNSNSNADYYWDSDWSSRSSSSSSSSSGFSFFSASGDDHSWDDDDWDDGGGADFD